MNFVAKLLLTMFAILLLFILFLIYSAVSRLTAVLAEAVRVYKRHNNIGHHPSADAIPTQALPQLPRRVPPADTPEYRATMASTGSGREDPWSG